MGKIAKVLSFTISKEKTQQDNKENLLNKENKVSKDELQGESRSENILKELKVFF